MFPAKTLLSRTIIGMACFGLLFSCQSVSAKNPAAGDKNAYSRDVRKAQNRYPGDFKKTRPKMVRFAAGEVNIDLYAGDFAPGNVIYIEICKADAKDEAALSKAEFRFGRTAVSLTERTWGYRGFFAVEPEAKPGQVSLNVNFQYAGQKKSRTFALYVSQRRYKVSRVPLDLGKFSDVEQQLKPEVIEFIKRCAVKKNAAFSRVSPDQITGFFCHPRDGHYVTSPYWSKRVYMRYKIRKGKKIPSGNATNIHRGVDFRGAEGDPVFAMSSGTVALAEPMYYEGNFIIIDHGNRTFSYYMHMSRLLVKTGDTVRAGQKIGLVGSTGISTASHLHVSLMIKGVQIDPLSLLYLPIRD